MVGNTDCPQMFHQQQRDIGTNVKLKSHLQQCTDFATYCIVNRQLSLLTTSSTEGVNHLVSIASVQLWAQVASAARLTAPEGNGTWLSVQED